MPPEWGNLVAQGPLVAFFVGLFYLILKEVLVPKGRLDDLRKAHEELARTIEIVRQDRDDWKDVALAANNIATPAVETLKQVVTTGRT